MILVLENGQQMDSRDPEALERAATILEWESLEKAVLTAEKAKKILRDGEVHGKPLTEQQRKYFGAVASGTARKSNSDGCDTPGEKIWSKGKGRGLAVGGGKGPIGVPGQKSGTGESPGKTSTKELTATLDDIKARLKKKPGDAALQTRQKAISAELGRRTAPDFGKAQDPQTPEEEERLEAEKEKKKKQTPPPIPGVKKSAIEALEEFAKGDEQTTVVAKKSSEEVAMSGIDQLSDFAKSKYIKRTGTPGNYKYEYPEDPKKRGIKKTLASAELSYMKKYINYSRGDTDVAPSSGGIGPDRIKELNSRARQYMANQAMKTDPITDEGLQHGGEALPKSEKKISPTKEKKPTSETDRLNQRYKELGAEMERHRKETEKKGLPTSPGVGKTLTGEAQERWKKQQQIAAERRRVASKMSMPSSARKSLDEWLEEQETDMSNETELMKALGEDAELAKSFYFSGKRITEWSDQFYSDTGLEAQALRCVKDIIACQKKWDTHHKAQKPYRDIEDMPRKQREAYRDKQSKARNVISKEEDAVRLRMRGLEEKLVDYRIKEAEVRQALGKGGVEMLVDFAKGDDHSAAVEVEVVKGESGTSVLIAYLDKAQGMPGGQPEKVEDQLKDKPSEHSIGSKSLAVPGHQREMVAHENAQVVSRLRKGPDDITLGPGIPTSDETAARMAKGGDFYAGGMAPTIGGNPMILTKRKLCRVCNSAMAKSLAVCPHCGDGAGIPQQGAVQIAVSAERHGPILQARGTKDIIIK